MTDQGSGTDRPHNAPCSNRDYDFFYEGLTRQQLLVQSCGGCGRLRNPPSPSCPHCLSLEWSAKPVSGEGTVFSYIVHRHPPLPDFETPHPVAVIDLAEGVRFTAAMDGTPPEAIHIGMPVRAEFLNRGAIATVRFKPA